MRTRGSGLLVCAIVLAATQAGWAAPGKLFAPPGRLVPVGPNPSALACRDLNDDGFADIVCADRGELADPREERPANDEVSLLISDGKMNFTRQTPPLKTGFAPWAVAVANVDGLKWPDVIVVNFLDVRHRDVCVFLNQKNEGLFEPVTFKIADETLEYFRQKDGENIPVFTKPGLTSLVVQDFNGDGLRDLLAAAWCSDVIVLMHGHQEQYFSNPQMLAAPGAPRDLRTGDFNRDGNTDFAAAYYATGEIGLWRGNGRGGFEESQRFPTRGALPTAVRVADMNMDGFDDILVSHSHTEDSIVIFYGDDGMTYSLSQEILLGSDRAVLEHEIRDLVVDDLNGDGRPDIAAACFASSRVTVLVNNSKDSKAPQSFAREDHPLKEGRPRALETADFDNDGKKDLAVALWDVNAVGVMRNAAK